MRLAWPKVAFGSSSWRRGQIRSIRSAWPAQTGRLPTTIWYRPFTPSRPNRGNVTDFWVRHYDDAARQQRDWRYDEVRDGVLYPRVRALGGCTAHHAMITVRPNNADWNHIAETMGDPSWRASQMQGYWERVERCRTRWFPWRWLARVTGWNPLGHGWRGWMTTELALPLRTWPIA